MEGKEFFNQIVHNKKNKKREIIKQRDGTILVIDYDDFNQLIS